MANITDKITDVRNAARPVSARVSVARATAATSLACNSLTGWPTASKVHFVTYQIDTNSDPIDGTQLDCSGIVSGNSITQMSVLDGTDAGNSIGDVVEMLPTASWGQDLADALSVGHTRTGAHAATLPLTTPVLTTPSIADFSSATHTHGNNAGGGQLTGSTALVNSTVTADKLSTGAAKATVVTSEQTSSTSYADLSTSGPSVTVTVGANGLLLVAFSAQCSNGLAGANCQMSFALSGANTLASADVNSSLFLNYANSGSGSNNNTVLLTGLTPGSTTVKAQYKVGANTGTWSSRVISAVPL